MTTATLTAMTTPGTPEHNRLRADLLADGPMLVWHIGADPVHDGCCLGEFPAWRTSTETGDRAIIRCGGDGYRLDSPGFTWEATVGVYGFTYSGTTATLEEAMREAHVAIAVDGELDHLDLMIEYAADPEAPAYGA